ncbi:hypothetical protein GGF32_007610 [Allomyces javanicus]|nr:hypothetical protein GGF32_007610 [Allomyces javanicus]
MAPSDRSEQSKKRKYGTWITASAILVATRLQSKPTHFFPRRERADELVDTSAPDSPVKKTKTSTDDASAKKDKKKSKKEKKEKNEKKAKKDKKEKKDKISSKSSKADKKRSPSPSSDSSSSDAESAAPARASVPTPAPKPAPAAPAPKSAPTPAPAPAAAPAGRWNDWTQADLGDSGRQSKFLRLLGAKKAGADAPTPAAASTASATGPTAINAQYGQRITADLEKQFEAGRSTQRGKQQGRSRGIGFR